MRKIIPVVAAGATTLALAGTTFGYANLNKSVTLSVDGQTSQVRTSADTVGALLKSKESRSTAMTWWPRTWMPKSKTAPGSPSSSGGKSLSPLTVPSRPFGPPQQQSMRRSVLSRRPRRRELSTSRSSGIGRQGLAIIIATEKTVVIIDAGKKRTSQPPVKHWPMPCCGQDHCGP